MNKTSTVAQQLLDGEAQEITRKVIELAKQGNPMALKLCLERVLPPRKDRPVALKLAEVKEASDVPQAFNAILAAVSQGDITPSEAGILAGLVGATQKAIANLPKEDEGNIPLEAFEHDIVRALYTGIMVVVGRIAKGEPIDEQTMGHLKHSIWPLFKDVEDYYKEVPDIELEGKEGT